MSVTVQDIVEAWEAFDGDNVDVFYEEWDAKLTGVKPDGEALLLAMREAVMVVAAHTFPRLKEVTVKDDGETYKTLRCPICDLTVDEDELAAVSVDEHWCYNSYVDDDAFDHGRITFDPDIDRDLGETVFYLHNDDHAVSLPEGWTEDWS